MHLWVHLLLSANHRPEEFMWNNKIIIIKEGQLITGRKQLSSDIGIPESTVEDILNLLEKEHQIQQQKLTKFRIITIINWVKYQNSDSKSDNRATTEQQQSNNKSDTNKKIRKNIKKNKKDIAKQSFAEQKINLNSLLEKFEPINPNFTDLFANKTQRAALEDLIRKHGYAKIESTIAALPQIVVQKYAPRITTPLQLKQKLGDLIIFVKQNQSAKKIVEI